ncbi:MAG TPA: hypothetical protein PLM56_12105 [Cyclobacteriaceae bacterium]|jgi:hypothetical protein|nr:hypothetical protein [Cytophagales bacterium]HMR57077.1 hypothetical protein [Cyclobacteriaceae bacterium]HRE66895.1 hypothetical protein [Cyclobacteriaceae bacterium]HRF34236.1 hypothetical protein [Cyclobacteriaceae bacterium]
MNNRTILSFLLVLLTSTSWAQKTKYKDLIVLINARNYEVAEPHLKKYLRENTDNVSAYLYMAIIYQDKAQRNDILKQPDVLTDNIDSAIMFFEKVAPLITERELKRNDENYEMYLRRDTRTAEIVIKLSDVTLDIETRLKNIRERKEKIKNLNEYFRTAERQYKTTQTLYSTIQGQFANNKEFYLRMDETVANQLKRIGLTYDSAQTSFKNYRSVLETLGKVPYNQVITLSEIADFKKDGNTEVDFLKNDLRLWDYSKWTKASLDVYQNEIVPLRDHLVSYDSELNKLTQKLKTDSASVKSDLTKLLDRILFKQLTQFDPDPLPTGIFKMKAAELEYRSDEVTNKAKLDTAGLVTQLEMLKQESIDVNKLDSLSGRLMARDFENDGKDYKHFITKAYGTETVLRSYIKSTHELAQRAKALKQKQIEQIEKSLRWVVNGADSIPLFTEEESTSRFKPLVVVPGNFTFGLKYADSLATGYLVNITPMHVPTVSASFTVTGNAFKKRYLSVLKGLGLHPQPDVYLALVYSETMSKDGYPATLAKVGKAGLVWSLPYSLEQKPSEILYSAETGEVMIKLPMPTGEQKLFVVDKYGKKIQ